MLRSRKPHPRKFAARHRAPFRLQIEQLEDRLPPGDILALAGAPVGLDPFGQDRAPGETPMALIEGQPSDFGQTSGVSAPGFSWQSPAVNPGSDTNPPERKVEASDGRGQDVVSQHGWVTPLIGAEQSLATVLEADPLDVSALFPGGVAASSLSPSGPGAAGGGSFPGETGGVPAIGGSGSVGGAEQADLSAPSSEETTALDQTALAAQVTGPGSGGATLRTLPRASEAGNPANTVTSPGAPVLGPSAVVATSPLSEGVLAPLGAGGPAPEGCDELIYANDFESPFGVGPEWSSGQTSVTPSGDRFLGHFANQTVTLTLDNVPASASLNLSFDLYVIRSWDGNSTIIGPDREGNIGPFGPDVWELSLGGGSTLLRTSFSNNEELFQDQAFPGPFPGGSFPAGTGAAERDTLGYSDWFGDSVYDLSFDFAHAGGPLVLRFSASGLQQALSDESWGLDNVTVDCLDIGTTDRNRQPVWDPRIPAAIQWGDPQDAGFDGVFLHNGAYYFQLVDLEIPGRGLNWTFERTYRSDVTFDGSLGHNWDFNYNRRLVQVNDSNLERIRRTFPGAQVDDVVLRDGYNRDDLYMHNPGGSFTSPKGLFTGLTQNGDGTFSERLADGTVISYGAPDGGTGVGPMTRWTDRNGNALRFEYNPEGRLSRVIDTLGRPIDYFYTGGRLTEVRDFFGRSLTFSYDGNGDLAAVTGPAVTGTPTRNDFPGGKTEAYSYSSGFADVRLNHNLLTITAPNEVAAGGPPRVELTYDNGPGSPDFDRVLSQAWGGTNATGVPAGGTITYGYLTLGTAPPGDLTTPVFQTTVTDRNGNQTEYQFNQLNNSVQVSEFTNRDVRTGDPDAFVTSYAYNQDYQLLQQTFPEGNAIAYDYDTDNPDRFQQNNRISSTVLPDARGGDQAFLTTTSVYEPIYNQLRAVTDPRGNDPDYRPPIALEGETYPNPGRYTTVYTFDYQEGTNFAALAQVLGVSESEVQQRLADAGIPMGLGDVNGDSRTDQIAGNVIRIDYPTVNLLPGSNQAVVEGDTTQEIVELYAYNPFGQMTRMVDPEENVHRYTYYSEQDPNGDSTIDNPAGDPGTGGYLMESTWDTANAPGRNSSTDPEPTNIRRRFAYDPVGNVTREVDGRGIATDYAVNQLNQVVQITRAADLDGYAPDPLEPLEPLALTAFGYVERLFYDFNNNLVLHQVEDRGNTSGVEGNLPALDLPVLSVADVGVSTGAGPDSLEDSGREWELNQWVGFRVYLTGGNGIGQVRTVIENDETTLTLDAAWDPVPEAGSGYFLSPVPDPDAASDTAFVDTAYRYDILDNPIEMLEEVANGAAPEFLRTRYRYDANQNLVLTILPEGNATTAIFDERDLPFQTTRGALVPPTDARLGNDDPVDYDVRGGILCQCTTFHYDGNRNVIETVDAADTDGSPDNNSDRGGPGDRTRTVYDGFDRPTSVIDSVGNQTVYQYDPADNLVRVSHFGPVGGPSPTADGPDVLPGPVSSGGVIQTANLVNDNLLAATEYVHDELNRVFQAEQVLFVNTITTVHQPDVADGATDLGKGNLTPGDDHDVPGVTGLTILGRVSTRTEYDRSSRLVFTVEDDGDTARLFYDGADRVTAAVDPEGNTVELAYDDNDNLIEVRETDVAQVAGVADEVFLTTHFYDSLDRLQRTVDNLGQTVDYRYDSRHNLVAMADAQGPPSEEVFARRLFPGGALTVDTINAFGNVTLYFYDGLSRQTRQEVILTASGQGDGVHIGATEEGVKTTTPSPDPAQGGGDGIIRTGYLWDQNSLLSALLDDQGNVTLYLYDNLNRMVTETKGLTVNTAPLNKNKILGPREIVTPTAATINDPDRIVPGRINDQLALAKDRIDAVFALFPALADRVDDAPPTTVVYGYDQDDNLLILEDENDSETFALYDAVNRLVAARAFRAGQADSHAGDAVFAPAPLNDPSNPSTTFPAVVGTTKQDFAYDGLSRLTQGTDDNDAPLPDPTSDDSTITFAYDSLSRVIEETQQHGAAPAPAYAISSAWRAENLRSGLTYPNDRVVVYTYDGLDRLQTVADEGAAMPIADYDYIGVGRILQRLYPLNGTRLTYLDDAGTTDVGYDGLRRPVQLRHLGADDSLVVGFTHSYDRMNNKLSEGKLHDPANSESYGYDSAYRLVSFQRAEGGIAPLHGSWALDGVGNWAQVDGETRQHSSFNEITQRDDGAVTPILSDDNGNQFDDGTLAFEWDFQNRLRTVTRKTDGQLVAAYSYDAAGRRIRQEVSNSGGLDGTTDFYLDGGREVEEHDGTGALTQQYVYGIGIDEPLALDRDLDGDGSATGAADQRFFYHQNSLGSVFALTDAVGSIAEGYQYEAYGAATVFTGPGLDGVWFSGDDDVAAGGFSLLANPFLFTGRRLDAETRLYHYRARYLNTEQGRFLSRDPAGYADAPNLYGYAAGSPANLTDPSGRWIESGWDLFSLGVGVASLGYNLYHGNYGAAALDAVGVVADAAAVVIPIVPGGAGVAIRASRTVQTTVKTVRRADQAVTTCQGVVAAKDAGAAFARGDVRGGLINAGGAGLQLAHLGVRRQALRAGAPGNSKGFVLVGEGKATWTAADGLVFTNQADFIAYQRALFRQSRTPLLGTPRGDRRFWTQSTSFQGNKVYQRNDLIDPNQVDARGRTNLERMRRGLAPLGPDGEPINVHHMLQTQSGPLAEMTETFHSLCHRIIHINPNTIPSGIDRSTFNAWRRDYWRFRAGDF